MWELRMHEYRCSLDRIIDGDTIDVHIDLGFKITSSTIPFGYKLSEDQKTYEPVEKELELLDKAFDYVRTVGPAKASRWLSTASGRKISNPGLTKRMDRGLYL